MDEPARALDRWTVAAIAVVAYALSNVVHEGLGHGGACLLGGGRARTLNAIFFDCDSAGMTAASIRLMAAAGTFANLLLAAGARGVLGSSRALAPRLRYFLWLLLAINLLQAFGYLLFSGLGGVGDWAAVVAGTEPAWAGRLALAVGGSWLYFVLAPRILMPLLDPFLGETTPERVQRATVLSIWPYAVGGLTYVAAGMLNPHGLVLVLISAVAASLGGTSLLVWYPRVWARRAARPPVQPPLALERGTGWWLAALLVLALFVGVLGPGIHFAPR
jgi:hypothetical protein